MHSTINLAVGTNRDGSPFYESILDDVIGENRYRVVASRFIRNDDHFRNTVRYIGNNPVKAGLCKKPSEWPFSSAWFHAHGEKK